MKRWLIERMSFARPRGGGVHTKRRRRLRWMTIFLLAFAALIPGTNALVGGAGHAFRHDATRCSRHVRSAWLGAAIQVAARLGMARALFATALAQFLVPIAALIVWRPDFSPGVVQVFALNFGFVLLFTVSGLRFRHAAGDPSEAGVQSLA